MPNKMNRAAYAQMFGPTVGDKVRLAILRDSATQTVEVTLGRATAG